MDKYTELLLQYKPRIIDTREEYHRLKNIQWELTSMLKHQGLDKEEDDMYTLVAMLLHDYDEIIYS